MAKKKTKELSLTDLDILFGYEKGYGRALPFRVEKVLRIYFNNIPDELAARLLQVTADKVPGLYDKYLRLAKRRLAEVRG